MQDDTYVREACSCVVVATDMGLDTYYVHIMKVAIAMCDTHGFVFDNHANSCHDDYSRNYVISKWTHALPSNLHLLERLTRMDGERYATRTGLEYWKVLMYFGIFTNCLGNIKLATKVYKKVKIEAEFSDLASKTEIDRDISGLTEYPSNTCCVCLDACNATACGSCHISCYCSKRCQRADWVNNHKEICGSLLGWKKIVFPADNE
jgi:hypothetical protein